MKPDSHGGVPIDHYLVRYKDASSQEWKPVKSQGTQSKFPKSKCNINDNVSHLPCSKIIYAILLENAVYVLYMKKGEVRMSIRT